MVLINPHACAKKKEKFCIVKRARHVLSSGFPSWSIVLCFSISIDSLILRENLWLLVAKMDASFHFMRWSLVQECLATADFSSSAFSQLVLCSLRRNERFRPISPIYTKPHSHGIRYTPGFWNSLTLSLCVQRDRNNLFSLEWYNWMPASFKILSILCEAEPIYSRLTEDWYSVFY